MQVVLVSQNEQPAISVRMIVRAGAAHDPKGKHGLAMLTATLLDQGAGKRSAEQIAETIDFIGGVLGTGAGTDMSFINADRDEGQLRDCARPDRRCRAAADVCAGRDRAAARAGAVGVEGRGGRPGVGRRARDRSPDLRIPSVRHARRRHGGIADRVDARRLRGIPQAVLRPEQRPACGGRRHQRRRGDGRPRKALRRVEAGRRACARHHRGARRDAAGDRHRQEGCGADRDSRRPHRDSAQAPGLRGDRPGREDPRRRRRQSPAAGAAVAKAADLRRVRRSDYV